MAMVFVFIVAVGPAPRLAWLELVPLIALLAVFAAAVTLLAGALYVRLRDVAPIWQVLSQLLFFGSPSAIASAGGWANVSVMLAVTGSLLGRGLLVFRRMAPHAAENL
jgi:hypothetical protein